jgi:thiamine-phosphate pyrophosphorylase
VVSVNAKPQATGSRKQLFVDQTSAVSLALERAQCWAQHQGADSVSPVHLLLGLLEEEESRPVLLLARRGIDPAAVRNSVGMKTCTPSSASGTAVLPLSAEAQAIMRHAAELGRMFSAEHTVASDQVLLAILRHEQGLRAKFESLGLVLAHLEEEIVGVQGTSLPLDEPLDLGEPREQIDTARILDAAANRAREGLRVLEDYCRFVLDDAFLTSELKRLRHDLAAALADLPANLLLEARDTLHDVGTDITTAREHQRQSLEAVAQAGMKRLQEALRSLEEFGKLTGENFGPAIEAIRYRAYTLERALLLGASARRRLADARLLVLVSEESCRASLSGTIHEAVAGGADIIQLREKNLDDRSLLDRARSVRAWTRKLGVLFILNDRPDIARLADADGVHLGQEDLPIREARRILGPDALIGISTHSIAQVRQAVLEGASYIGIGPTFPSETKEFDAFPGLEFIRQACAETSLPAFAIGGITLENLPEVIAAGARRAAVGSAICQAEDPRKAAAGFRMHLSQIG